MNQIEKVDLIRERLNVSYEQANKLLQETQGDVLQALIKFEEKEKKTKTKVKGRELLTKIRQIIASGNTSQITVKKGEQNLVEIPVSVGLVGLALFPYMGIIAGLSAMYSDYTLEIVKNKKEGFVSQNYVSDNSVSDF
ncbi:MAG: DUF4342 domain-containing protein [bacterium]